MDSQPNILLVMSDQHSPHFLGCAGDSPARTPSLDRLAARGVRFDSAYCANPLCVPSRMTFLTCRHSSDIRVWCNQDILASDIPTFAHALTGAGYDTILCGRMHFRGPDQRHGYQRRIIGDVHVKLDHIPVNTTGQHAEGVRTAGPGRTAYQAYDEAVVRRSCEFLEELDRNPSDRPFFLTVGSVLPHCPYIAPKRLFDEYYEQIEAPALPEGYVEGLHPAVRRWREVRAVDTLTDEQVRVARAAYCGLVTYFDELLGQILDTLDGTRLAENTIVVYTSDHGDMAGEHRMWWKSNLYEGSVKVPLIISWPGHFDEGRTVDAPCSLLDIGPTLLEIARGDPMPNVRGSCLCGFLRGAAEIPPQAQVGSHAVLAEFGSRVRGDMPARMVRRGPWKLNHYHSYDRPQLFNLQEDPGEWRDVGADPAHADVREELLAEVLQGWSGEDIIRWEDGHAQDRAVLTAFERHARIPKDDPPDRWTAPDGCNVFPER